MSQSPKMGVSIFGVWQICPNAAYLIRDYCGPGDTDTNHVGKIRGSVLLRICTAKAGVRTVMSTGGWPMSVCLAVCICLSVRSYNSKTTWPNFTNFTNQVSTAGNAIASVRPSVCLSIHSTNF